MSGPEPHLESYVAAMQQLTAAIEKQVAMQRNWKIALRNGVLAGLGGVLGATILVSILIAVTQPFKRLETIGPMIERLDNTLKQGPNKQVR